MAKMKKKKEQNDIPWSTKHYIENEYTLAKSWYSDDFNFTTRNIWFCNLTIHVSLFVAEHFILSRYQ